MLYAVKFRYIDLGGVYHLLLDGYSYERGSLSDVGERDYGNPDFCAYSSRKSALDVKRIIDSMLADMVRRRGCKKAWKAKIVEVRESDIPPENYHIAIKNAAIRYYFTLGV